MLHYDNCVFCGECVRSCTTQEGIDFTQDYELSGFDLFVLSHEHVHVLQDQHFGFDDEELVAVGDGADGVPVGTVPDEVRREDRARPRADRAAL